MRAGDEARDRKERGGWLMEEGAREKEVACRKEKGTELVAVGGLRGQ